jgi:hypothetical protein
MYYDVVFFRIADLDYFYNLMFVIKYILFCIDSSERTNNRARGPIVPPSTQPKLGLSTSLVAVLASTKHHSSDLFQLFFHFVFCFVLYVHVSPIISSSEFHFILKNNFYLLKHKNKEDCFLKRKEISLCAFFVCVGLDSSLFLCCSILTA